MDGPSILNQPIPFEPYLYETCDSIKLPEIKSRNQQVDFLEVFSKRRSVKILGECPIELLSEILYYAVKPYCIGKDDYGVTVSRCAAPSAGGRHPIDILVGIKKDGIRQLFLYQPLGHSLSRLSIAYELQKTFYEDIEQTLPIGNSVLLWFSVQYMRTASKYTNYMSLIWRDVGAQLCCLQQAAKYMGVDSCPIGYLAEDTFKRMFRADKLISGGGMIIGK